MEYCAAFPVAYRRSLLVIYFKYSRGVCVNRKLPISGQQRDFSDHQSILQSDAPKMNGPEKQIRVP